jgi:hypothetical protein
MNGSHQKTSLSAKLATDVFWLSVQTGLDCFEYHHWHVGQLSRSLVFGCYGQERTWDYVEGKPEPWEREALFSRSHLFCLLRDVPRSKKKREFIKEMWRNSELVPGRDEPKIDAWLTARKIAWHYRFPNWLPA